MRQTAMIDSCYKLGGGYLEACCGGVETTNQHADLLKKIYKERGRSGAGRRREKEGERGRREREVERKSVRANLGSEERKKKRLLGSGILWMLLWLLWRSVAPAGWLSQLAPWEFSDPLCYGRSYFYVLAAERDNGTPSPSVWFPLSCLIPLYLSLSLSLARASALYSALCICSSVLEATPLSLAL